MRTCWMSVHMMRKIGTLMNDVYVGCEKLVARSWRKLLVYT